MTVLKVFPNESASRDNFYTLLQMSPDARFAFVKHTQPAWVKDGKRAAYYVVNVESGNTRMLLKDEVQHATGGFMSEVFWVR